MMQVSIFVCALGLLGFTAGQVVQSGTCSTSVSVVEDFDADQYTGLWHEVAAYPSVFQNGSCVNATYTLDSETDIVSVYNAQVLDGTLDSINGTAVLSSDDGSAKLEVTFTILDTFNVTQPYWVLATDYTSYALVYSCTQLSDTEREVYSWKLSRTTSFTDEVTAVIDKVISETDGLDQENYIANDHSASACSY